MWLCSPSDAQYSETEAVWGLIFNWAQEQMSQMFAVTDISF